MTRFSDTYETYTEWKNAMPRDTRYGRRIIRFHQRFPNKPLSDLRNLRVKDYDISKLAWKTLNPKQKRGRVLGAELLRKLNKGQFFTPTLEKIGMSRTSAMRHVGTYLKKENGKWKAIRPDSLQLEMMIYEKGKGIQSIITKSSDDRVLIGKYFAEVQKALESGDDSGLKQFEDVEIEDADGIKHKLETDLEELYKIEDQQEEPEFLEIYRT